ncbi:MAG: hypothetical protein JWO46_2863 [Nocardioidaceae bacterium]|nr:hypothetical protein [Nocardioidaceae bacterium]
MRPLWFVAGAGAGVYVMLRARRLAEAFTPEGLHDRLAGLQVGWDLFSEEVRTGMTEKETELRQRFVFGPDEGIPALPPGGSAPAIRRAGPGEGDGPDGHQ